jgi:hypothetical protein
MRTQEEDERIDGNETRRTRESTKLLPMYAASRCSLEWLETVEGYQDDLDSLQFVLQVDFCELHRHLRCDCGACDSCAEEQFGHPHACFLWMFYP